MTIIDLTMEFLFLLQERIARKKKEGTFLTKAQKEQQAKAQAMLESMKKQGMSRLCWPLVHLNTRFDFEQQFISINNL